jgi:hypothetical protein
MKIRRVKLFFSILSVILALTLADLACNFPGIGSSATATPAVPTFLPPLTALSTPTSLSTGQINLTAAATSTALPATATPTPSQTATVTHLSTPGTPSGYGAYLYDSNSSVTASLHRPQGGDYFNINLFERPFNTTTQDTYFPQVDILQTSMQNGSPWVYGSITLDGTDTSTNQLDASYALELDLDLDGRGDVLVVANNPAQGSWSTNGVQVFEDPDNDVGGNLPLQSEALPQGNGYEQKVFDSGQGADPDLAWSRVDPAKPNVVWFAFKPALINNASRWLWGAWAQMGGLHPELFDYDDHFTLIQAGNPFPGNPNYPLKALAELDNTCRWAVGFAPTGIEPGLCQLPATATPTATATKARTRTPTPRSDSQAPTKTPTQKPPA